MVQPRYLSAAEAAQALGIQLPTLYAYVSRGLIRSEETGGSKRERRYYAEDVARLVERQEQRRNPTRAAETALHWGTPVLESALTLIDNGRVYYRGRDAIELAQNRRFEQVATLLWTGDMEMDWQALFSRAMVPDTAIYRELLASYGLGVIESFQTVLPLAASLDATAFDRRVSSSVEKGARILCLLTWIAAGMAERPTSSVPPDGLRAMVDPGAEGIANALCAGRARRNDLVSRRLVNAALVLSADHELNISAFTARAVASAGSTLYAVVNAGLSALQGPRHGGHTLRVQGLFQDARKAGDARRILSERLKRGEEIPGFGHRLYPEGDPRGRALLEWIREAYPRAREVRLAETMVEEAGEMLGEYPTIDFALVLLARVLELGVDGAIVLFALGRTAGWIAHALEQYETNQLIRPRARYVGPLP